MLVAILGGFAEGYVYPKIYARGDAAKTGGTVIAHSGLVRAGVIADLIQATVWIFAGLTLYLLLNHVHKGAASTMVVLVAVGAGITCLNAIFEFEALRVATGAVNMATLGSAGSNGLVLLLVDAQHFGLLAAQIFFGLWLAPLAYLALKSAWFPKALGVLLAVGGACYLVGLLAAFLFPGAGQQVNTVVTIPSAIAEIWMVGYLLLIGVKTSRSGQPSAAVPALN